MTGRKVYFIRHGQTDDNVHHIYSGQADTSLNDQGRKQARIAVPELAKLDITHIFSSDLSRCVETATIVAAGIRFPPELIRTTPDLREVDVGSLRGKPERGRDYIAKMRRHDPGIETREHVYARLRHLLAQLPRDGNILLVGHQGSGAFLEAMLAGIDPLESEALPNGAVRELKVDE